MHDIWHTEKKGKRNNALITQNIGKHVLQAFKEAPRNVMIEYKEKYTELMLAVQTLRHRQKRHAVRRSQGTLEQMREAEEKVDALITQHLDTQKSFL